MFRVLLLAAIFCLLIPLHLHAQGKTTVATKSTEVSSSQSLSEPSEYWPSFYGYRFKITDSLLVLFTLMLVITSAVQAYYLWGTVTGAAEIERAIFFVVVTKDNIGTLAKGAIVSSPNMEEVMGNKINAQYFFKNYGKTPALIKKIGHHIGHGKTLPFNPPYEKCPDIINEQMIDGEKSTQHFSCRFKDYLKISQVREILEGKSFMWLCGHVIYEDIFGKEHEHRFVYRYGGNSGKFAPYFENKKYSKST